MFIRTTFTTLLLLAQATLMADVYRIDGQEVHVPAPEGFVPVDDSMPMAQRYVKQMADPMNDTLAFYLTEADAQIARAGEFPPMERTMVLKINKQLRDKTVGQRDFKQMIKTIKEQNLEIIEKVKAQAPDQMKQFSQGVSEEFDVDMAMNISQMIPLKPFLQQDDAMGFSMYIKLNVTSTGIEEEAVVAVSHSILNAGGKVLFLYANADMSELEWTQQATEKWTQAVLAQNEPAPSQSLGIPGGFDWSQVGKKAFIGAIIGGVLAIGASIWSKFKKN